MNDAGQKLLEAIQAKGCDARDLRDAAHEAHHALFVGLRPMWTRDRIHDALVKRAKRLRALMNGELVGYELDARAVEWVICERFEVAYDLDKWADIMWWETAKNMHIRLPNVEWIADAIRNRKGSKQIERYVNAVMLVAGAPGTPLTNAELKAAAKPIERCVTCGHPRNPHRYRHPFRST